MNTFIMLGNRICLRRLFTSLLKTCGLMELFNPLHEPDHFRYMLTVFQSLYVYDKSQCQDPRDLIFALRNLSHNGYKVQVDYNQDVRSTYLNLVLSVSLGIVDDYELPQRYLAGQVVHELPSHDLQLGTSQETMQSVNARVYHMLRHEKNWLDQWGFRSPAATLRFPDGAEALRMFAIHSCKKRTTTEAGICEMEIWFPDWTVTTGFDSPEHRSAVEFYIFQESIGLRRVYFELCPMISRNRYTYLALEGIFVEPPCRSDHEPTYGSGGQIDRKKSQPIWVVRLYEAAKAHCQQPDAESDRIWVPGEMRHYQVRVPLGFVLRPSPAQVAFNGLPVYRLQSCFRTHERADMRGLDLNDIALWKRWLQTTNLLSWQAFCLD